MVSPVSRQQIFPCLAEEVSSFRKCWDRIVTIAKRIFTRKQPIHEMNHRREWYQVYQEEKQTKNIEISKKVNNLWNNQQLKNGVVMFVHQDYHLACHDRPKPLFEKIRRYFRGGPHIHTGMVCRQQDGIRPHISHVTYNNYENRSMRMIELLASDFVRIDTSKLLKEEKRGEIDPQKLQALFEEECGKLQLESRNWKKIHNNTFLRYLTFFKPLRNLFSQNQERYDFSMKKGMICTEFVAKFLITATSRTNDRLGSEYLKSPIEPNINLSALRPTELYELLIRKCGTRLNVLEESSNELHLINLSG